MFMIFTLYNIDYILNIVYYHVYNHSKQLELSIQFMFSCNRDFHSACWGEFAQKKSTLFNGIDSTGVASNIKTQIQFNTPSCMSKLHQTMQTWALSSWLWQSDENEKNASIYSLCMMSTTNQSLNAEGIELLPKGPIQSCQEFYSKLGRGNRWQQNAINEGAAQTKIWASKEQEQKW